LFISLAGRRRTVSNLIILPGVSPVAGFPEAFKTLRILSSLLGGPDEEAA
jgi:hypothetical protein